MIEVTNIRIPLARYGTTEAEHARALRHEVAHVCHVGAADVRDLELRRQSFDARHPERIVVVATVRCSLAREDAEGRACSTPGGRVRRPAPAAYAFPSPIGSRGEARPVVVGAGCAGLFCALALAEAGLAPLLVERGRDATRRTEDVRRFERTGILDSESNVQFGLGGAGTFSDGKLATGTKSPAHRTILETFVACGASPQVLYDAHPHVGSDVLPRVVEAIRARIEGLGGEVALGWRLTGIEAEGGRVRCVVLEGSDEAGRTAERRERASQVALACGHSARDVYEMLDRMGVALERKPFAMGVRIEHLQADIDRALWGPNAGNPVLGAAPYKLACHLRDGRGVFSFCMCPGGRVMAAASEPGGVVTNGASDEARDGKNANAGLLVGIDPADVEGEGALAGIELQRACERRAFAAGGGGFVAPAQLVGDFLQGTASSAAGRVEPTYPRGVAWGELDGILPGFVIEAMRAAIPVLGRRLKGFDAADAVLTGVETRSSSPVRIVRDAELQSPSLRGLYPAGEGAGYAGGIMSAATDGLRVADAIVSDVREHA
jgi:uncharacterized FAD-dependent dehydrogenase